MNNFKKYIWIGVAAFMLLALSIPFFSTNANQVDEEEVITMEDALNAEVSFEAGVIDDFEIEDEMIADEIEDEIIVDEVVSENLEEEIEEAEEIFEDAIINEETVETEEISEDTEEVSDEEYDENCVRYYKVTYNTCGGSYIAPVTVKKGCYAPRPQNPTKPGYSFDGWYLDAKYKKVYEPSRCKITKNMTVYAKWTYCAPVSYTVCFNSMGGSGVPSQSVVAGALLNQPANPVRSGYTFDGWYTSSGCYTRWNFGVDRVYGNMTLYAKWIYCSPTYFNVCFNSMGGSYVNAQTVVSGSLLSQPPAPTKNNYVFEGWYRDYNCTSPWNFGVDRVYSGMTLYAKWTYCPVCVYSVNFNTNGGSYVPSQSISSGGLVNRPANPIKPGYIFAGWYKDSSCRSPWSFYTDRIYSSTTIYARWVRC